MRERERIEIEAFLSEDRKEQAKIAASKASAEKLAQLQKQISLNTGKLARERHKSILGYTEEPYVSPDLVNAYMSWEDAQKFNGQQAQSFFESTPDWYGSPENIETLTAYFLNRNIFIIDAAMFRAAFLSLKKDGLFEDRPAPLVPDTVPVKQDPEPELQRVPLSFPRPVAHRRPLEAAQKGFDPVTGLERVYTAKEIDDMDADTYKRTFRLSIPALTKVNFQS